MSSQSITVNQGRVALIRAYDKISPYGANGRIITGQEETWTADEVASVRPGVVLIPCPHRPERADYYRQVTAEIGGVKTECSWFYARIATHLDGREAIDARHIARAATA